MLQYVRVVGTLVGGADWVGTEGTVAGHGWVAPALGGTALDGVGVAAEVAGVTAVVVAVDVTVDPVAATGFGRLAILSGE